MKNKCLSLVLLLTLLCGCAATRTEQYENPIRFYYCRTEVAYDQPGGTLESELRDLKDRQIEINEILRLYLAGPVEQTLVSPFPAGLTAIDAGVQDGTLTVRLGTEYARLRGAERTTAAACLTLTMTQIRGVSRVCIETEEDVVPEQRAVVYTAADFLLYDASVSNPEWTATLYFRELETQQVRTEKRAILYQDAALLPELVLTQLLDGPTLPNLVRTVPEGTRCMALSVDDGICSVVLSQEFADCDTDAQTAQWAVRTVVATLCALPDVESVQLSVLGVEDLQYYSIRDALCPAEDWF